MGSIGRSYSFGHQRLVKWSVYHLSFPFFFSIHALKEANALVPVDTEVEFQLHKEKGANSI